MKRKFPKGVDLEAAKKILSRPLRKKKSHLEG